MNDLIRSLNITKETSLSDIEQLLLDVPDFSPNFHRIKGMNVESWYDAAVKIYNHLHQS
jgi:hypothetical protein